MDRQQTGNILIGAGVLTGLGTIAYWLLNGGWEQVTEMVTGEPASMSPYVPQGTGPAPGIPAASVASYATPSLAPSAAWLPSEPAAFTTAQQRFSQREY